MWTSAKPLPLNAQTGHEDSSPGAMMRKAVSVFGQVIARSERLREGLAPRAGWGSRPRMTWIDGGSRVPQRGTRRSVGEPTDPWQSGPTAPETAPRIASAQVVAVGRLLSRRGTARRKWALGVHQDRLPAIARVCETPGGGLACAIISNSLITFGSPRATRSGELDMARGSLVLAE